MAFHRVATSRNILQAAPGSYGFNKSTSICVCGFPFFSRNSRKQFSDNLTFFPSTTSLRHNFLCFDQANWLNTQESLIWKVFWFFANSLILIIFLISRNFSSPSFLFLNVKNVSNLRNSRFPFSLKPFFMMWITMCSPRQIIYIKKYTQRLETRRKVRRSKSKQENRA